ncbi:Ubiquitin carboxyl-terminal hydrolase, putative isoform 1 [Hibiscus syriacus]|uniref:Ubiquitin carboxyl-terminal hydrolase, putative isoform 1 n=1 Tax=Hibiscus syriacus TaxID=106335 RepID=A0A6A3AQG8_HIBSY|nr:Ubiquitin carboxyl-terminal hydrolase, putative isoform 1 [Hibiscus syriacus]
MFVHTQNIEMNHTQTNSKMGRDPYKHLALAAFFLFFISTTAGARNLPGDKETQKSHDHQEYTSTKDGAANNSVDELVSMDYTPATRKPPIHN